MNSRGFWETLQEPVNLLARPILPLTWLILKVNVLKYWESKQPPLL